MTLPVDTDSDDYKFYKTLLNDIKLVPNEYSVHWDIVFENGDLVNLSGKESLKNAICLTIMTRANELYNNPTYSSFGCRIHELIKSNKSNMVIYKIEQYITQVLKDMRRIKKINEITVIDNPNSEYWKYKVYFNVTSFNDELINGEVNL